MISFKDNFFFLKFSVLFFIVTIFGYWGIDLNSEELYIAFSFFFLAIVAFLLARASVVFFFTKAANKKYLRLLADLIRVKLALDAKVVNVRAVVVFKSSLALKMWRFFNFLNNFVLNTAGVVEQFCIAKLNELAALSVLGAVFFAKNNLRVRKFGSFSGRMSKLFSVTI